MHKLCVILSSCYDHRSPSFMNEEVAQDLLLIKSTLADHQIIEISLPCSSSKKVSLAEIQKTLAMYHFPLETACHIVLNTHGKPGLSDIKHDCVIELLHLLSYRNVSVVQISALQCEGMKPALIRPAAAMDYKLTWTDLPRKLLVKEADLMVLQKKISRLLLVRAQHFFIRGFDYAYEPEKNKSEIEDLLRGHGGLALAVSIKPRRENFAKITHHLELMRRHHELSKSDYYAISNSLSKIMYQLKLRLFMAIQAKEEILSTSELYPLLEALCAYAHLDGSEFYRINPDTAAGIYRSWLKTHKIYSIERMNIVAKFVQIKSVGDDVYPGPSPGVEPDSVPKSALEPGLSLGSVKPTETASPGIRKRI